MLVLAGTEDLITPATHSEAIARVLPEAELVLVPGAGHLVLLECPAEVNRRLAVLLERAAGRAGAELPAAVHELAHDAGEGPGKDAPRGLRPRQAAWLPLRRRTTTRVATPAASTAAPVSAIGRLSLPPPVNASDGPAVGGAREGREYDGTAERGGGSRQAHLHGVPCW